MSIKPRKPLPGSVPTEIICTITRAITKTIRGTNTTVTEKLTTNWHGQIPQDKKVAYLTNLAYAEHEILILQKHFQKSDIIDPHTGKNVMIPKGKDSPNA